jgi:signal transduction histidine kinase
MVMAEQPLVIARPAGAMARRLRGWRDRYGAWPRRHPRLVDAGLVAVLLLISLPELRYSGQATGQRWSPLLVVALLVPLVWRRRAPFAVFLIVAAVALIQWLSGPPLTADLAPLVAFYTVAAYEPLRRALVASAIMEAGAVMIAFRFGHSGQVLVAWVFISGLITAVGFIGFNIRTRRAYLVALQDRAARLEQDRDREAQLAASGERARIAREMHDIVAHNLAVMIALADGAAYTADQDLDRAVTIMGQVSDTGRSALTEMRRLLGVMRQSAPGPEHAPQPTLADLDDLLATVRSAGLQVRLTIAGQQPDLPPSAQLAIYRLVQEALTNVLKHAEASEVRIRLAYLPASVEIHVVDNGRGADPPDSPDGPAPAAAGPARPGPGEPGDGQGIVGMRERAAVFGGTVSAGPAPGGGWRVHAVLLLSPTPGTRASVIAAERAIAAQRAARPAVEQLVAEKLAVEQLVAEQTAGPPGTGGPRPGTGADPAAGRAIGAEHA